MKKYLKILSVPAVLILLNSCSSIDSAFNTASTTSTLPVVTNDLKMEVSKNVNVAEELYAAGKSKIGDGGEEIARNKAELSAKDALRKAIQTEAFKDIKKSLEDAQIKSADLTDYKIKGFANEIAVELLNESEKRAEFQTGNNEIGVIYVVAKSRVKEETSNFFQNKLKNEIERLQTIQNSN